MAQVDGNSSGLTVAVVGAECAGKTTLTAGLAKRFDAPWVPEYAREYLASRTRYDTDDVLAIARGQHRAEAAIARNADLIFADTDLVVIKIWWQVRFGGSHTRIDTQLNADLSNSRSRCYLLPTPDIPWIFDPLRENPKDRLALHARYRALLDSLGVRYLEVSGSPDQRLDRAAAAVIDWLNR